jgi:hypothetical protein
MVLVAFFAFQFVFHVVGCGSFDELSEVTEETTDTTEVTVQNGTVSLGTDQVTVKSDNSGAATITASVIDSNNLVVKGVRVDFSATAGMLKVLDDYLDSDGVARTDADGEVKVYFSSGTINRANQTATITAEASELKLASIPIQITGTTITLSTDNSNLEINSSDPDLAKATLTITVKDAGDVAIYNVPVTISMDTSSTGLAALSATSENTNVVGEVKVDVTGTGAGSAIVKVESQGLTASETYTVGTTGSVFGISSPTTDPASLSTNTDLTITVSAPNSTNVMFGTTLGAWDGGAQVVTKAVSGGQVSADLNSPEAGIATIQVYDTSDMSATDSLKVAISAPSSEAFQIMLQASSTVVAPTITDVKNTITLTATVKNASDQVVGNSPVAFSLSDTTGGGEIVSPVIVFTDNKGIASSTFTSGSLSSDQGGVTVNVTVIGTAINDNIAIVIGGTAGSVTIGVSTKIESINNDTTYELPMCAIVTDSNGNVMTGVNVSLSAWPTYYAEGVWVGTTECFPDEDPSTPLATLTFYYPNEDINFNLILDAGEDTGSTGDPCDGDGLLTPPSSAAGSVPANVTTDENGVANFSLIYPKTSAAWIMAKITASTIVLGSETRSTYNFTLGWLKGEECNLPDSPYNCDW